MASEVDICNLALAHLGDAANVSSINPPDTSAQAGHCARFYPIARDSLLEMHPWGFSTKRVALALMTQTVPGWSYVYASPTDVANYLQIYDPNEQDEFSVQTPLNGVVPGSFSNAPGIYTPQTYVVETDSNGDSLIYTNQENANLMYSALITDPTKFSPLFIEALAYFLASKLAGPLIKGQEGRQVAAQMMQAFSSIKGEAINSDANQRRVQIAQSTAWLVNR